MDDKKFDWCYSEECFRAFVIVYKCDENQNKIKEVKCPYCCCSHNTNSPQNKEVMIRHLKCCVKVFAKLKNKGNIDRIHKIFYTLETDLGHSIESDPELLDVLTNLDKN